VNALNALSQHEARAFESHLRDGCPECESELGKFERVVGLLGSTAQPVSPPAYMRDLIASRIEKEARPSREDSRPAAAVIQFPEQTTAKRESQRAGFRHLLPWAVAASLLIAFVYTVYYWQKERRDLQGSINSLKAEAARADQQLAEVHKSSRELSEINSVLASEGHQVIALKGGTPAPASSAQIYWDMKNKRWVVSGDLPPAPAGKAYQLWFITPDAKISAGIVRSDASGHVFHVVDVPFEIVGQIKAAAFTLEPETGSPQPTSEIYAFGEAG
jgi:Anti-sigma-K factor rskA